MVKTITFSDYVMAEEETEFTSKDVVHRNREI
jgi:hypothetical protein